MPRGMVIVGTGVGKVVVGIIPVGAVGTARAAPSALLALTAPSGINGGPEVPSALQCVYNLLLPSGIFSKRLD